VTKEPPVPPPDDTVPAHVPPADVPSTKGDIVFVWPTIDVIATWHLG
jgi:hypothetical protein